MLDYRGGWPSERMGDFAGDRMSDGRGTAPACRSARCTQMRSTPKFHPWRRHR